MAAATPLIQRARSDDGLEIAYWSMGDGPPALVILPPALSDLKFEWRLPSLAGLYRALAAHFRVIRYDPRNCGQSARKVEDLSLGGFARDVDTVVRAVDVPQVALIAVGHAVDIALRYAIDFPERAVAIAIAAPGSSGLIARADEVFDLDDVVWAHTLATWIVPPALDAPDDVLGLLLHATDAGDRSRMFRAIGEWEAPDRLSEIRAPVMIVQWPENAMNDPSVAERIELGVPNATSESRGGQGQVCWDPDVDEVVAALASFVRQAWDARDE